MKIKAQLLFFVSALACCAKGQVPDTVRPGEVVLTRSACLLAGISFGTNTFVEVGLSKNSNAVVGHHPFSSAYFISTELKPGDKLIIGPKLGAWAAGGVGGTAMGLNMIYYTDFDNASLVFRPEIGFGHSKPQIRLWIQCHFNAPQTRWYQSKYGKHCLLLYT